MTNEIENFEEKSIENDFNNIINSVGSCNLSLGRDNPISLKTNEDFVYRITGMDQINDIINCGFVRPKGYGSRRDRVGDKIYWSIGGKVCYYDKRPVLEAPLSKIQDGQIGPIPISDLSAIWLFDEQQNKYINKIDLIYALYLEKYQDINEETINKHI